MSEDLKILERKFESFLNQTILGASKDYYKMQKKYYNYELQIIDNEDYEKYLNKFIMKEDEDIYCAFDDFGNNYALNCGIKSLSSIEKTVIFLCFKECYSTKEISKIIGIREQSVSRIKRRSLDKLEMFMKGYDLNE